MIAKVTQLYNVFELGQEVGFRFSGETTLAAFDPEKKEYRRVTLTIRPNERGIISAKVLPTGEQLILSRSPSATQFSPEIYQVLIRGHQVMMSQRQLVRTNKSYERQVFWRVTFRFLPIVEVYWTDPPCFFVRQLHRCLGIVWERASK